MPMDGSIDWIGLGLICISVPQLRFCLLSCYSVLHPEFPVMTIGCWVGVGHSHSRVTDSLGGMCGFFVGCYQIDMGISISQFSFINLRSRGKIFIIITP